MLSDESVATSSDDPPGRLLGYVVALRENDAWNDSWDGTIHPTLEAALSSCTEAFEDGWDVVVGELRIK